MELTNGIGREFGQEISIAVLIASNWNGISLWTAYDDVELFAGPAESLDREGSDLTDAGLIKSQTSCRHFATTGRTSHCYFQRTS